jgi:hypothetical protein
MAYQQSGGLSAGGGGGAGGAPDHHGPQGAEYTLQGAQEKTRKKDIGPAGVEGQCYRIVANIPRCRCYALPSNRMAQPRTGPELVGH